MAFFDTETVPEHEKVTPMRFFNWGPGSDRIAAFADEWQARDRPLDDVTGEAMTWVPPVSPTSAGPVPRPGSYDKAVPARSALSPKKRGQLEAEEKTREVIERWGRDGKEFFVVEDLERMSDYIGKGRTWYYGTLRKFEGMGLIEMAQETPKKRWRIRTKPRAAPDLEEEPQDESERDDAA
jgi:hypothetical protein